MGSPALFQGTFVKFLKDKLNLFDKAFVLTGTQDPRVTATEAPKGSIMMRQGPAGQVFSKLDDGTTTNWKLLPFANVFDIQTQPAAGFNMAFVDEFDVPPDEATSLVDNSRTTGTYDPIRSLYHLECDKSLTITTVGTGYTLSGAPGFTMVEGDIIYSYTQNTFRRVIAVTTPTTGTLDAAFAPDLSGGICMVSQAVWTKDLVNFAGSDVQETRPRDFYPGEAIYELSVDYFDSLADDDDIPDFVDEANVVVAASTLGVYTDDSTTPDSDDFTEHFIRPIAPAQIDNYPLEDTGDDERLFLTFFCNPSNVAVSTSANLIRYRVSFYTDESLASGGILDSAFAMSDGSATEINCAAPALFSGATRLVLDWNYIPGLNPGETSGDLEVLVDGKVLPRRVIGATQDAWYEETSGTNDTIDFWDDLSVTPLSIEVRRRQGSIDTSDQNATNIDTVLSPLYLVANQTLDQRSFTRVLGDTSGGAFEITLPASPALGDRIEIQDPEGTWATNNLTINPNGNEIQGVVANDILDVDYGWIAYEWFGASEGWMVRT